MTTPQAESAGNPAMESKSLNAILRSEVDPFFAMVWQNACAVFHGGGGEANSPNPFHDIIHQGWEVLIDLLDEGRRSSDASDDYNSNEELVVENRIPLLFKNQSLLTFDERQRYGSSLMAAFLDGCSVVINHADLFSPWIAALCEDLQFSFPHAYANTYLTPPGTQTVPAHADDRDVFVIQVVGRKAWRVYQRIPVPFPYPHEQVGKNGLEVPLTVLEGPVMIDRILKPGDVLYMPRGYVHEAQALSDQSSFHITVALATHDWSLASLLLAAGQHIWQQETVEYRRAVRREIGRDSFQQLHDSVKQQLQEQIDTAMAALKDEVTVEAVHQTMQAKYRRHNERARKLRDPVIKRLLTTAHPSPPVTTHVVGRMAAEAVRFTTRIRLASMDEKQLVTKLGQHHGLYVRDEIFDSIMSILCAFKRDESLVVQVKDLHQLLPPNCSREMICDMTLLCFARHCVELGALAVQHGAHNEAVDHTK